MLSPPAVTNLKTAPVDGNENDDTTTITYASNATINTDGHQQKQQQQKHPQRKCFQCGQVGHQTANCTSSTRNQEGIEAFEEYLEEIEKRRQQYSFKKKHKHKQTQRRTKKFNHLKKIQSWWTDNNVSRCTSMTNEEHNNVSPSAVQNVVVEQKRKHETNNDPIQQVYDSKNFELIKSLHQSYGELFNDIMERVQERFEKGKKELLQQQQQHNHDKTNTGDSSSSSSSSPFLKEQEKEEGQDHQSIWQEALNTAVRNGEPADFSNHDDNWVYAQYKLVSRTRYLHHLILDHDNDISKEIRQKLSLSSSCASGRDSTATAVQVCSVGGGPGYDHLAICLVSWYLYQIQKTTHGQEMSQKERKIEGNPIPGRLPRHILTQIFDLYNEEWNSIMEHLQFCFQQETAMVKATDSSDDEWEWWQGNQMTMNFGDLRCANGVGNNNGNEEAEVENENINSSRMMKSCLCSADLIVFSFVLHENSSFLLVQEHNGDYELGGVLKVMLESAKKGAIVICMDSGNTLWPSFRKTALQYGWNVMSDAQKSHKIILGPKSFCLMKRVQICNPNEM